jgi:hypothetical protein
MSRGVPTLQFRIHRNGLPNASVVSCRQEATTVLRPWKRKLISGAYLAHRRNARSLAPTRALKKARAPDGDRDDEAGFLKAMIFPSTALLPQLPQINPQLLALLIEMAPFQAQRFGGVGDVIILAGDFFDDDLALQLFHFL